MPNMLQTSKTGQNCCTFGRVLQGSAEEIKQADQRSNSRFIVYVPGVHTLALKKLCTRRSPLMEVMDTMMTVLDHFCFLVRSLMVRSLRLGHVLAGAD